MEYLMQFAHALVSPVNCVGNLGVDVLHAFGNFAQCVGGNLGGITDAGANVVGMAATSVTSIGA